VESFTTGKKRGSSLRLRGVRDPWSLLPGVSGTYVGKDLAISAGGVGTFLPAAKTNKIMF